MNRTETVTILRLVKSLCPHQQFDEYTPDAWALVLDDVGYDDAKTAVRTVYREQGEGQWGSRKIEADDLRREVRHIRAKRIADHGDPIPPFFEDVHDEIAWMREARRRIGDGEHVADADRGELKARPTIEILTKGMTT